MYPSVELYTWPPTTIYIHVTGQPIKNIVVKAIGRRYFQIYKYQICPESLKKVSCFGHLSLTPRMAHRSADSVLKNQSSNVQPYEQMIYSQRS